MKDHMPSDLVPLHDGMILSFVNYELKVRIESKSNTAQKEQLAAQAEFFEKRRQELDMLKSMGGAVFTIVMAILLPIINLNQLVL